MALTKLTQSLIDGTLVTSVNGNTGAVTTGIDLQSSVKTANFTAVANEGYLVNTTSSAITVTLPSSPSLGDEVLIIDYAGTFGTNNVTLTSSDNILGSSDDYAIQSNDVSVILIYTDATKGWKVKTGANEGTSAIVVPPINVDYLVVAGGGGGSQGGGGAGGYLTSTNYSLTKGSSYTITIGGGGNGSNAVTQGLNGSNSVFDTLTSIGGGGGGYNNNSSIAGSDGGSGGGGGAGIPLNVGGSGTSGQGNDGGNSNATSPYPSGGGGGAGFSGENGVSSTGGDGGDGLQSSITGTSTYYAGGGGGGVYLSGTGGVGGLGGGGNGNSASTNGVNGTANTGSGGGGSGNSGVGGNGSSGVVIVRYPNTYTITVGAGLTSSTATDGSDKVTTFTAGTDTISFS